MFYIKCGSCNYYCFTGNTEAMEIFCKSPEVVAKFSECLRIDKRCDGGNLVQSFTPVVIKFILCDPYLCQCEVIKIREYMQHLCPETFKNQ